MIVGKPVSDWLKEIGHEYPCESVFVGFEYEGEIIGAFVYSRFDAEKGRIVNMEVTMVFARPQSVTRERLRFMTAYPFKQLGAERLTARVEAGSTTERIARFLGFEHEGTMRRINGPDWQVYGKMNYG